MKTFSFFFRSLLVNIAKKHNVTYVISTTCHSEASEITSFKEDPKISRTTSGPGARRYTEKTQTGY